MGLHTVLLLLKSLAVLCCTTKLALRLKRLSSRNVHATGEIIPRRHRSATLLPSTPRADKHANSPGDAAAWTRRTADRRMGQVRRGSSEVFHLRHKEKLAHSKDGPQG
ncbi:hypothetical protein AMECASPLE_034325 [Ameca splendens]|uniref:Secreted protein n=1 Tax=Ameca splendens TaxID=208324 RepID=A0ABV0Z507_9TELE